jgi:hypothetical protein
VTTAPTPTEPLTSEEQDAADALWAAVAAAGSSIGRRAYATSKAAD